jgi:hypothetical protein
MITPACRAASPISTLYVVLFKKKRLKAQDIIGWEEPLPGGGANRPKIGVPGSLNQGELPDVQEDLFRRPGPHRYAKHCGAGMKGLSLGF